jgi:hypothetical protein
MKKGKQWEKPAIGVVARSKSGETTVSSRSDKPRYYMGPVPAPAPYDDDSLGIGRARNYLGLGPLPPGIE